MYSDGATWKGLGYQSRSAPQGGARSQCKRPQWSGQDMMKTFGCRRQVGSKKGKHQSPSPGAGPSGGQGVGNLFL